MNSNIGLFMNIVVGIVGAIVLNAILAAFNIGCSARLARYLIIGFIGACLLIAIAWSRSAI